MGALELPTTSSYSLFSSTTTITWLKRGMPAGARDGEVAPTASTADAATSSTTAAQRIPAGPRAALRALWQSLSVESVVSRGSPY